MNAGEIAQDLETADKVLGVGLPLISRIVDLIANARAARAEESSALTARLEAADAALDEGAPAERAAAEDQWAQTQALIDQAKALQQHPVVTANPEIHTLVGAIGQAALQLADRFKAPFPPAVLVRDAP
jgi:hypothetical protein